MRVNESLFRDAKLFQIIDSQTENAQLPGIFRVWTMMAALVDDDIIKAKALHSHIWPRFF